MLTLALLAALAAGQNEPGFDVIGPGGNVVTTIAACAQEDGNTDGRPCIWTDPDTGEAYYVDSENYR